MPPAAAVVPSPSGTPPSSSPKVASPQAASLPSSSTEHNALTAGRDAMSSIHHREGATSLLPSSSPIVAKPPKKRKAVVVAGLSTSSTATRDDSTTTTVHPPSSSSQQNTTPPPPQRVCSRCACLSSCAWHKSKTTANASLCETCYRCEALELVDKKCHSCETTKTSRQWYKSKIAVGDLCKRCYRIELVALQHKTCIACSSQTTSGHWYKSKLLPDGDLCNNCYGKVCECARDFFLFFSNCFFVVVPDVASIQSEDDVMMTPDAFGIRFQCRLRRRLFNDTDCRRAFFFHDKTRNTN